MPEANPSEGTTTGTLERLKIGDDIYSVEGGGGGTGDYNDLKNQPQIGGNTLIGNKTASDLGLVAAEAGKGLSENDYTDADKAIVGGVTAALAGKADKSAVKNEFIGKTAEWNALTAEQKKAYDTYQITDDYTEGGGGLPDYSTTEQKTGQKWVDGKDIYFKVLDLSSNPIALQHDSWVSTTVSSTDIDKIIDSNVTALTNSDENVVVKHCEIGIINGNVAVCLATSVGARRMNYVTIYYTKTA
jgi:hypothetical protein